MLLFTKKNGKLAKIEYVNQSKTVNKNPSLIFKSSYSLLKLTAIRNNPDTNVIKNEFAKEIIKKSKVQLFLVNDNNQLAKFLKMNMYGKKIVIGMGAGSISNWMAKLPQLM